MNTVHVVLPNDIDDPLKPSGGNVYDRRVCDGLAALGWRVHEHAVAGDWPDPTPRQRARLKQLLATLPGNSIVLIDGLMARGVPADVVLMHMPLGDMEERRSLSDAEVITTSEWSRGRLIECHGLPTDRIHVARPGAEVADVTMPSASGSRLLCVGTVAEHKGQDVLAEALATLSDLDWTCTCAGTIQLELKPVDGLSVVGPCDTRPLYAQADLLVMPSRVESYGMAATEAIARGVPVLASDVGGLPEAVGDAGLFVPPGDPIALSEALRRWLTEPDLRHDLRRKAQRKRQTLNSWAETCVVIARVLSWVEVRCA